MRKRDGDEIFIFNGEEEWKAKLSCKGGMKIVPINLIKKKMPSDDIWLCFSLIKSKNINYLIEKTTEVGVKRIVPIITEFSEKFNLNYERLNKIIIEAVEQSDAINVPKLQDTISLEELLDNWDEDRIIIFCDENRSGSKIFEIPFKKKKMAIFIGPVGGWSEKDKKFFKNKNVYNVNLGKNILKADTAAIISLSMVKELLQ
tara:strand:- start:171 stop:776 length:606 start_codon:yes stop_codon:yes gene_type:complete